MLMIRRLCARTSVRNGVISMTAPWVAAGEPLEGKPSALEGAVSPDCLKGIFRAGGDKAATSTRGESVENGGNGVFVDIKKRDEARLEELSRDFPDEVWRLHVAEGTRF